MFQIEEEGEAKTHKKGNKQNKQKTCHLAINANTLLLLLETGCLATAQHPPP